MSTSALLLLSLVTLVSGHGRVVEPASRASAWRLGFDTPPDYDDDGVNCGGMTHQWVNNGGRCGICGDAYDLKPPRPHELGGTYGQGIIVGHYNAGAFLSTTVQLTTSHRGFWEFKLCPDPDDISQDCFDQYILELEDGGTKYYPTRGSTSYQVTYVLPRGLVCEHCVLQWRYTAGNNWGDCRNGTQAVGCGDQEQFGACSDISIGVSMFNEVSNVPIRNKFRQKPVKFAPDKALADIQKDFRKFLRSSAITSLKPHRPKRRKQRLNSKKPKKKHRKKASAGRLKKAAKIRQKKHDMAMFPNFFFGK